MCGIAGIIGSEKKEVSPGRINSMLSQIEHRGPDESGVVTGPGIGLGSVRLSIIDLESGQQPMTTKEKDFWIVFNGEIFNYLELRTELKELGYSFNTESDTEVLLLLFKQYREKCLEKLNGQFAFAIWDVKKQELFIGRDRMGIRPLFYYHGQDMFVFGSEIKCIIESGLYQAKLNHDSLNQVFTFWTTLSPNTMFKDVFELPPGHYLTLKGSSLSIQKYWKLEFGFNPYQDSVRPEEELMDEFESLLTDSVRLRLRSDVQVAAYLSGGLDSSATTYLIKKIEPGVLNTFSIGFHEKEFDESSYQQMVSSALDTSHESFTCYNEDIASYLAKVLWHTEIPLLRTGAIPMYLLSKNVHSKDIKVVITGEGADEFLGGYNIFKEALIREFWSKEPKSTLRPLLLQKLYPYLEQFQGRNKNALKLFFGFNLMDTASPIYSHQIRWNNSKQIQKFFTADFNASLEEDPIEKLLGSLPDGFSSWDLLSKSQWIEANIFLSGYLLSSQGDRMALANSVEGRYPFLDHRVIEFSSKLPEKLKIKGLTEKYLLKKLMKGKLPDPVINRSKQAYRAPVTSGFISSKTPEYIKYLLSSESISSNGLFRTEMVEKLLSKTEKQQMTENENMALSGVLTTQVIMDLFVKGNNPYKREEINNTRYIRIK